MWDSFKEVYNEQVEVNVPTRKRKNRNSPKWMTKEVKRTVKRKRSAWETFEANGTTSS